MQWAWYVSHMSDSTGEGEVETKDFNGAQEVDYGIHIAVSIVMYVSPRTCILYKISDS